LTDTFGDRMKRYEAVTRTCLLQRTYTIIRIDGKAFHTFTNGLPKPYCQDLANAMDTAATVLCCESMGCRLAYGQSDEYSFLLTDFERHESEPWFAGGVQKIVSVAASIFTAEFNRAFPSQKGPAYFDARVFTIPSAAEVENYFIWRQQDAERNSLNMLASFHFSHKQLHDKGAAERHDLLHSIGVNWNNQPTEFKRGRVIRKQWRNRTVEWAHKKTNTMHSQEITESYWGVDREIPVFTKDRSYLSTMIPTEDREPALKYAGTEE
jgi:tRNA(His) guanylyltransferase